MTPEASGPQEALRRELDAHRAPSGAYPCDIDWGPGRRTRDENGFSTALVVRRARRAGVDLAGFDRTLDFLESCAAEPAGAYAFWSPATRPPWAAGIPADADDTAVITLELLAHGRITEAQAVATLTDVLLPAAAARSLLPGPSWWRAGVFPTWLRADGVDRDHVLDCGVNANVLALMAVLDARDHPAFGAALAMVDAAVRWCREGGPDDVAMRADSIAPYYATPAAVAHILDDAVWLGASELAPARDRLGEVVAELPARDDDADALWRNAYGGPLWRCPALRLLDRSS